MSMFLKNKLIQPLKFCVYFRYFKGTRTAAVRIKWHTWKILCSWFRASLIYNNSCPTRCNTNQYIYYSASSLCMFRVSTTPIIRSTQNCHYSLRYWSATVQLPPSNAAKEEAAQKIWPVPEAVITVLCTPDDVCGWHPKHVEWTCRTINRLLCVAYLCNY